MELLRRRERTSSANTATDITDRADPSQMTATLVSGPYTVHALMNGEGQSLQELRRRFVVQLDLDPNAIAVIDGREALPNTIVQPGQLVMFTRRAGEKGGFHEVNPEVIPWTRK